MTDSLGSVLEMLTHLKIEASVIFYSAKPHSSLTEDLVVQLNYNFKISFRCISPPILREIKFAT